MAQSNADKWPKSRVETLNEEISLRMGRISDGKASSQDVSEVTRLIRERADSMMPAIFR